ncbi:thioredoxin domain-containing protein, partial [Mycobacterium tuberculosis]|nr:thioredoxin domain-containing protein [Mycobacterium tuberculosis]
MQPGPLPDKWLGKADAPITIIEYASMTCPHCQSFHLNVLPHVVKTYVD